MGFSKKQSEMRGEGKYDLIFNVAVNKFGLSTKLGKLAQLQGTQYSDSNLTICYLNVH